jgi:hypothetical protein
MNARRGGLLRGAHAGAKQHDVPPGGLLDPDRPHRATLRRTGSDRPSAVSRVIPGPAPPVGYPGSESLMHKRVRAPQHWDPDPAAAELWRCRRHVARYALPRPVTPSRMDPLGRQRLTTWDHIGPLNDVTEAMTSMSSPRLLYYSATIITLDRSDTNAYGEPCEPGQGYTERSGFWDPDHGYWRVHDCRDAVRPDTYAPRCGQPPAR